MIKISTLLFAILLYSLGLIQVTESPLVGFFCMIFATSTLKIAAEISKSLGKYYFVYYLIHRISFFVLLVSIPISSAGDAFSFGNLVKDMNQALVVWFPISLATYFFVLSYYKAKSRSEEKSNIE